MYMISIHISFVRQIRVSLKLYSFVRETYSQRVHGYWAYADPNLTNHTSSSSAESLTAAMDGAADEKQQADSQNQTKLSTPVKTKKPSSTLTQTELRRSSRIKELQQKRESSDDGESVYTSASSASSSSSSSSSAPVPQPASSKKNMEKQPDLWWPFIYFLFAPTVCQAPSISLFMHSWSSESRLLGLTVDLS